MLALKEKIRLLATDIELLWSLGEVITLQIDLIGVEAVAQTLAREFNDSRRHGMFIESSILIEVQEDYFYDFQEIIEKILSIVGDFEAIDGVTAFVRMPIGNEWIEVTLELSGASSPPQILATADTSLYFDIIKIIQAKWRMAKARMMNKTTPTKSE